jgi:hypothetical protein
LGSLLKQPREKGKEGRLPDPLTPVISSSGDELAFTRRCCVDLAAQRGNKRAVGVAMTERAKAHLYIGYIGARAPCIHILHIHYDDDQKMMDRCFLLETI